MNDLNAGSRGWMRAARHGAAIGLRMTLLYAALFIVYAVGRSLVELATLPAPDAGMLRTMLGTAASLVVASLSITVLLLPVSAVAGIVTSLLLHLVLPRAGGRFTVSGTLLISFVTAMVIADVVQVGILPALGFAPLSLPFETWLFWFGLPTLIYVIVVVWDGGRLRRIGGGERRDPEVPVIREVRRT